MAIFILRSSSGGSTLRGPDALRGVATGSDTTPPIPNITVLPDRTRISSVTGRDVTTFTFLVDETYQAYQIRSVPASTSPVTSGTLIESGSGGAANTARSVDVTSAELASAGLTGDMIVKVFAQDSAGNWSSS